MSEKAIKPKRTRAVKPKPFGSEPDKVEKQLVGVRGMDDNFPESLPTSATVPAADVIVEEGSIPSESLVDTNTPEVWFAQRQKFVESSTPYEIVYAFCVDNNIRKIPLRSELNRIDPMSRPYEICSKLYANKES